LAGISNLERAMDDETAPQSTNPSESIASYYTAPAAAYRDLWAPLLEPAGLRLLRELPLREAQRVLDVGTGVGTLLPHIRSIAPHDIVVGGDRSSGMVALAPWDFPLIVIDVLNIPLKTGTFDVAVLAFMLFHVPDPVAALREVRRVWYLPGWWESLRGGLLRAFGPKRFGTRSSICMERYPTPRCPPGG
jgi:SAM-dependent methyltransferase